MNPLRNGTIGNTPRGTWRVPAIGALAVAASMAAGCATPATFPAQAAPGITLERTASAGRPLVALVLSEGSWRAFAHVGVIGVLEEAGIRPDLIVGVSAGAIVGAIYASSASASELARIAAAADWSRATEPALAQFFEGGLYSGEGLQALVDELVSGKSFEHLSIPFAAVATELDTGRLAVFQRGQTALAVRASGAVPGRYAPVRIGTRRYADGGLVSPLPTATARHLGADFVIAVDVGYPPGEVALGGFMSVVYQAFHVQKHRIRQMEAPGADVVIVPTIPPTSIDYGHGDRAMLVVAGERAARHAMPALLRKLSAWRHSTQAVSRRLPGNSPMSPPTRKETPQ